MGVTSNRPIRKARVPECMSYNDGAAVSAYAGLQEAEMAIRRMSNEPDPDRAVTPMSEIRRHKGMRLEEYVELYPVWADWMRNSDQLMYDAEGGAWVPRWDPEYGVAIGWEDDEEFTPDAYEGLVRESDRAMESVRAGNFVYFDELDKDESFWNDD